MKRSEMINKLKKFIKNDFDYYNKFPGENAENLLKTIEALGMIPPEVKDKNGWPIYVFPCWEAEDET